MNFIDRLLGRKAAQLTYDQVANLIDGVSGGIVAGVAVNEKTALQVSTVLACVKAITIVPTIDGGHYPALSTRGSAVRPDGYGGGWASAA